MTVGLSRRAAALVAKRWLDLAESDAVWKEICARYSPLLATLKARPLSLTDIKAKGIARKKADIQEKMELLQSEKQKIKQMIAKESKTKPLSDQKICDILAADGMQIARRTVAKYREAIGLGSSAERRRAKKLAGAS